MNIAGRTALVTGGSAGIGRELARQLAAKGATVVISGRDRRRLDEVVASHARIVAAYHSDFSSDEDVDGLIAQVAREHPELSLVINNAGIQTEMTLAGGDAPLAEIRKEIAVNFDALVAVTVGLLPVVAAQGGAIVNVSSGLALAPKAASPVYCATKAAVRSFTRAMRYQCEAGAPDVKMVDVIMALVDTGMTTGRGRGKISAAKAARQIIRGIERGRDEIWVGKTKLLRVLNRLSPRLVERIME